MSVKVKVLTSEDRKFFLLLIGILMILAAVFYSTSLLINLFFPNVEKTVDTWQFLSDPKGHVQGELSTPGDSVFQILIGICLLLGVTLLATIIFNTIGLAGIGVIFLLLFSTGQIVGFFADVFNVGTFYGIIILVSILIELAVAILIIVLLDRKMSGRTHSRSFMFQDDHRYFL